MVRGRRINERLAPEPGSVRIVALSVDAVARTILIERHPADDIAAIPQRGDRRIDLVVGRRRIDERLAAKRGSVRIVALGVDAAGRAVLVIRCPGDDIAAVVERCCRRPFLSGSGRCVYERLTAHGNDACRHGLSPRAHPAAGRSLRCPSNPGEKKPANGVSFASEGQLTLARRSLRLIGLSQRRLTINVRPAPTRLTAPAARGTARAMSDDGQEMWGGRFAGGPAELMRRINASIRFDKRLWREDIAASKAHAAMLREQGIIGEADAAAILEGLDRIAAEYERDGVPERAGARGHPHDGRASPGRADRAGGGAAAHGALAQRPGRDRFPAVGADRVRRGGATRSARCSARWSSGPRSMPTRSCPASPICRSRSR